VCPRYTVGLSRHELTDDQWAIIAPRLPTPKPGPGRRRADDRRPVNGILHGLKTGGAWEDVPRAYGAPTTCWRRLHAWAQDGTWARVWRARRSRLDAQRQLAWAQAFLDGRVVPANKGGLPLGTRQAGRAAT
jgi:transposase